MPDVKDVIKGLEWALENMVDPFNDFRFAGYDGPIVLLNEPIVRDALALLKAHEPRTCSDCRHYDTNAFTDIGGKCRNSLSCHYCYECDKSFGCNTREGR